MTEGPKSREALARYRRGGAKAWRVKKRMNALQAEAREAAAASRATPAAESCNIPATVPGDPDRTA